MRPAPLLIATTLFAAAGISHAASYYDPSNTASQSGLTNGHDLYRTIGCPGMGLLDPACQEDPARTVEAPAPANAPIAVAPPAPVSAPTTVETAVPASAPVTAEAPVAPAPAVPVATLVGTTTPPAPIAEARPAQSAGQGNPLGTFVHPLAIYCPIPKL